MDGKTRRRLGMVACALILLPSCVVARAAAGTERDGAAGAAPAAHDARFDTVRAVIQRLVGEEGLPSIAVAVAMEGHILWEEGFGWANRERGVRATPHTPYALASVTKPITSTAIMTLVESGRLDLDAPIERYLGGVRLTGFAADTREVTPRRIMAHSAGLPTHFRAYFADDTVPAPEQTLSRYGIVVYPPGQRFEYSNVGYRALDVAISSVSGKSYGEYLRQAVFTPLGMTRSAVGVSPAWASAAAVLYDHENRPYAAYASDTPGSGEVWSSAHDLLRMGMFHIGTLPPGAETVLHPESRRAMQRDASPSDVEWGLGWGLRRDRGYRVVEHGGGQLGVSAQLTLYPDEGLAIVVLSNRGQVPVQDVAQRIAAAVLPGMPEGPPVATPPAAAPPPLPEPSGTWVGTVTTYQGEEPFVLAFQPGNDLHATLGALFTTAVVRDLGRSGDALTGSFYATVNTGDVLPHRHNVSFTLVPQGDGLVGQLTARGIDAVYGLSSFVRLERLGHAELDELVGVYSHGDDDLRTITREGDRLYSQRGAGRRYALDPVGEDLFLILAAGGATLRFVRENGAVVAVDWNGRARGRRLR
jgi:CubicO group peptidase (beta-lactamase class C family)